MPRLTACFHPNPSNSNRPQEPDRTEPRSLRDRGHVLRATAVTAPSSAAQSAQMAIGRAGLRPFRTAVTPVTGWSLTGQDHLQADARSSASRWRVIGGHHLRADADITGDSAGPACLVKAGRAPSAPGGPHYSVNSHVSSPHVAGRIGRFLVAPGRTPARLQRQGTGIRFGATGVVSPNVVRGCPDLIRRCWHVQMAGPLCDAGCRHQPSRGWSADGRADLRPNPPGASLSLTR